MNRIVQEYRSIDSWFWAGWYKKLNTFFLLLCTNTELGTKHKICCNESLYAGLYQQGHFGISLKTGNENSYTELEQSPHHDQVHPLVCFVGKRVTYHLIAWCKYKSSGHFVLTRTGIHHHRSVGSTVAIADRLEQGNFKHYEMGPLQRPCKNSKSSSYFIESLSNFQLN